MDANAVYFPHEIFSNILSYNDNSLNRHKKYQNEINDFFNELQYNKSLTEEDVYIFNDDTHNAIMEKMVDYKLCLDISLFLLHDC